jgi:uncharacterized protein
MSLELIRKALCDYLVLVQSERGADVNSRTIKFTWHGGEPLLAGISYFREILDLQRSTVPSTYRVVNALTTNGVEINEEWIDFFLKENIQIGVSIDGPKYIHDAHRKWKGGKGSFDDVMRGIALLKESRVSFGTLGVVSSESAANANDVFDFYGLSRISRGYDII